MLALKVSVFVYENVTFTEYAIENIAHLDIQESEGEEKEIEEQESIMTPFNRTQISSALIISRSFQRFSAQYNSRLLEFATPPPQLGS